MNLGKLNRSFSPVQSKMQKIPIFSLEFSAKWFDSANFYALKQMEFSLICLTLQFSFENLTGQRRIGLAFAQLHDLALQEIQRGRFARLEIGGRPGI